MFLDLIWQSRPRNGFSVVAGLPLAYLIGVLLFAIIVLPYVLWYGLHAEASALLRGLAFGVACGFISAVVAVVVILIGTFVLSTFQSRHR